MLPLFGHKHTTPCITGIDPYSIVLLNASRSHCITGSAGRDWDPQIRPSGSAEHAEAQHSGLDHLERDSRLHRGPSQCYSGAACKRDLKHPEGSFSWRDVVEKGC